MKVLENFQAGTGILATLLLFTLPIVKAQNNYQAGFAKASINPPDTIFGLALGGYGAPAEGRFSTTWHPLDAPVQLKAIASGENELVALGSNNKTYTLLLNGKERVWKEACATSAGLHSVAYGGKEKYILDDNQHLRLDNTRRGKIKAPQLAAISSGKIHLYGFDTLGNIWRGDMHKKRGKWTAIGKQEGITAIAVNNDKFIFSDNNGRLWKAYVVKGNIQDKVQIGRVNGFTYTINIKSLAVANDNLYALDQEGKLFVATHKTVDNLEAGAVAIQNNGKNLLIITVDLCGLNYSFTQDIKKIIARRHHIAPEEILINISHTHFAPVSQAWTTWAAFYQKPDSNYLYQVLGNSVLNAVNKAFENLQPATLFFGRGETFIGGNRDAGRVNKEPVDRTLDVIKVVNGSGNLMGTIFITGCHPVFRNRGEEAFTISANYPAVARKLIAQQTGCTNNLFIQGCGGDINPISDNYKETGSELANDVLKILADTMNKIEGRFTAFMDSVLIPVNPMTKEDVTRFKQENEALESDVGVDKNIRWADLMLHRYRTNSLRKELPVYFQTLNIGSWKLVGISREAVTSYGMEIRKLWADQNVSVAGYCNDVSSYLPDAWHIQHKVYEGYDSFFWYGQEGIPPTDIQERIIHQIQMKNR